MKNIDLRICKNCDKIPKGQLNEFLFKKYNPFCSYRCLVVYGLYGAKKTYL